MLIAIAYHESGFRLDVDAGERRSTMGACGLWQLMPSRRGACLDVVGDRAAQAAKALKLARASINACGRGDGELAAYASGRCDRGLAESKWMVAHARLYALKLARASTIGRKGLL